MTTILSIREHSRIGFPKVKLKIITERDRITEAYLTVHGVIEGTWFWHNPHPEAFLDFEIKRFDDYVLVRYGNDPSVQG